MLMQIVVDLLPLSSGEALVGMGLIVVLVLLYIYLISGGIISTLIASVLGVVSFVALFYVYKHAKKLENTASTLDHQVASAQQLANGQLQSLVVQARDQILTEVRKEIGEAMQKQNAEIMELRRLLEQPQLERV